MPKVTFITDFTPKGQAPDRPTYKAGETYDLDRSYADKYVSRGLAVAFDAKAEREKKQQQAEAERVAAQAAKLEARGKILIPADLSLLGVPALIDLAKSVSDEPIKDRDAAMKAIDAEIKRRNPT